MSLEKEKKKRAGGPACVKDFLSVTVGGGTARRGPSGFRCERRFWRVKCDLSVTGGGAAVCIDASWTDAPPFRLEGNCFF